MKEMDTGTARHVGLADCIEDRSVNGLYAFRTFHAAGSRSELASAAHAYDLACRRRRG